jgi:hypothetical protein
MLYCVPGESQQRLLAPLLSAFRRSLKGVLMPERDSFEEFRDPETYDVEIEAYDEDHPQQ